MLILVSLAACQVPIQSSRSSAEPNWLDLSRTTTLHVFETAFRLNEKLSTPTESWAVKFISLQTEFERLTGAHLPILMTPDIANKEVQGWESQAVIGGSGHMRNVTVLGALRYVCEQNGFGLRITKHGFIITDQQQGGGYLSSAAQPAHPTPLTLQE